MRIFVLAILASTAGASTAIAADLPRACPATPMRVVRSAGGSIDYLGTVPGIPDLCRMRRTTDGTGEFYMGSWRSDWPGAGDAYPAMKAAIEGPVGTRTAFITRSVPGLQYEDSFLNEGPATLVVNGVSHRVLRLAHEREGIEGNTYHSVITQWKDIETGVNLKTVEHQISGQSYGPDTTWDAVRVEALD